MLFLGEQVRPEPRPPDRERQGHLVQVGPPVRQVRHGIDGPGDLHPDLGETQTLGRAVTFGEGEEARAVVGHARRAPPLAGEHQSLLGDRHPAGAVDPLPDRLRCPVHRSRDRQRHRAVSGNILGPVRRDAEDVAVHEAREFRLAPLERGEDLVAVRIGRVETAERREGSKLAAEPVEHDLDVSVDLGPAVLRAVPDERHPASELLADRGREIAGKRLVLGRFDDEIEREAHRSCAAPLGALRPRTQLRRGAGGGQLQ